MGMCCGIANNRIPSVGFSRPAAFTPAKYTIEHRPFAAGILFVRHMVTSPFTELLRRWHGVCSYLQ